VKTNEATGWGRSAKLRKLAADLVLGSTESSEAGSPEARQSS
jgi:hypothetical protein